MKEKRLQISDIVFKLLGYLVMGLFAFLCVYPIYYVFIYSISDPQLAQTGILLWPKGFSLEGYKAVFTLDSIASAFVVSVLRTVSGTILSVVSCGFLAYLMTQKDMPARKLIYRFMIITMYIGGGLIPTYLWMRMLHLTNSFLIYIVPGALSAYNVILIKTYLESVPASLEESAQLDGAGRLTIFFRIIMPLSLPILATIAVFTAVGQWGSWFDNMLYISNPKLNTLQYILYRYLNEAEALTRQLQQSTNLNAVSGQRTLTPESIKMAITMVVILPILFVYPYMQKYFMKGSMVGAIKG